MCLSLLLSWEAAATDPSPGPEEHPSSQMLLSCKLSTVTPLIPLQLHLYTHSSRQVLHLVCPSMELSALLPRSSSQGPVCIAYITYGKSGETPPYSDSCECSRSAKSIFLPHFYLWWQTDMGFRFLCLYYHKLFLFITSPAWLDLKPFCLWASSHIQTLLIIIFNKFSINSLSKVFSILHIQSHSVKIQFWDFQSVVHRIPTKAVW